MTGRGRIYRLPKECFNRGVIWPVDWTGPADEAHVRAIEMSRDEDVTVEYEDRVVSYSNGVAELV